MSENLGRSDVFLAFVADDETTEIVKSLELSRYGLKTDVQQGNAKSAVAHLRVNSSPRVLLVDLSGSEFPLTDMQAVADVCEPGVDVIAIGDANDVGLFRQLVSLGVKDYIAKPLNMRLLLQSIENVISGGSHQKSSAKFTNKGKLISFIGAHGGVGSSTLAANFAWALANESYKRVCLVDLDFTTGITSQLFNMENKNNFIDLLSAPDRIDESTLMQSLGKVGDYLSTLSSQVAIDDPFPFPIEGFEVCLPMLLHHFHYTVLDFPKYDHKLHHHLIAHSNIIVISMEMSLLNIREVVSLLRIFKGNHELQVILVANKVGQYKKGEVDKAMFEDNLGQEIDVTILFDNLKPLTAANEGHPVAAEKAGHLSDGIYNIISLVTGKGSINTPTKTQTSFFGGLFGGDRASNKK